ncbi:PIN domain-containing protein [Thermococcus sp. 101 C5]|uniref:type II toxin-antitoxin system VapC family toxin n=1 Tax=Thermococcus sp. 101 C5 TaxID=2654197 RepID=UPI00128E5632|nr:type II toxin-antitoxin system VapC family toxin [Thermococcus sp. 101 C5]MPW38801.1 PIN domain-containing protein [Thermococcus sp. 101 C5]
MKVVLDTNVFHNWKFLLWLRSSPYSPVISSVSYTEYLYHLSKKRGSIEEGKSAIEALLNSIGIEVLEFDRECALKTVKAVWGRWDFRKNARDYMICSLALKLNAPLVTYNKKDFEWYEKVHTPEEFMKLAEKNRKIA